MHEQKELQNYFFDIAEDINSQLLVEEEGANPEQIFTEIALGLLAEAGETENYRVCYDEKVSKRGIEHKLNAYALYENYEAIDLFITIYNSKPVLESVNKSTVEKALSKLTKFFQNALSRSFLYEIEESSEVFDFANTLSNISEIKDHLVRVNAFVLTNGEFNAEIKGTNKVSGYSVYYRVIDINYLYNLSVKSRLPIEINFEEMGVPLPFISSNMGEEGYQSYLVIIPGSILAHIYEVYGLRLLEQNVRSFLQFSGKINRGIRNTIMNEPQMFLAFNNGIATTAENVEIINLLNGEGKAISLIKDFQIINGGQTTAAIYHAWKKHKADISKIYVPMKLTIIKNSERLSETVSRIAEYANTQNKISVSDLSSNKESLVMIENLSRITWAPPTLGTSNQTRWFFERARGQYRNERIRQGVTPTKRRVFESKNPRGQVFTKELLAKYVNCFEEVFKGKKLVIGPHIVVRGSQKNYTHFLLYNFPDEPNEKYFQIIIAKAIMFKAAEKRYGISPNSIGDLRYITVPYTLSWLMFKISYRFDFQLIWREQSLPDDLSELVYELMLQVDTFIKKNAPGALYGEWAKKEECWILLKEQELSIQYEVINKYLVKENDEQCQDEKYYDIQDKLKQEKLREIKELGSESWKIIYLWARNNKAVPLYYIDLAHTIGCKLRDSITLSNKEIYDGSFFLNELAKNRGLLQQIFQQ